MDVYLLFIAGRRRPVFHAEHPDFVIPRDASGKPTRSPTERWWRALRARLKRVVRAGGPSTLRVWNWLNRRPPPDEPLLRRMRQAGSITLHIPNRLETRDALHLWRRYLNRRWRQHAVTFLWDLALSPLIALLMVLPGPNIVGYWFVYRIVTHLLAMRGITWARLNWIPLTIQRTPLLDASLNLQDPQRIAELEQQLGLDDLDEFLRRLSRNRRRRLSASDKPIEASSKAPRTRDEDPKANLSGENASEPWDSVF